MARPYTCYSFRHNFLLIGKKKLTSGDPIKDSGTLISTTILAVSKAQTPTLAPAFAPALAPLEVRIPI